MHSKQARILKQTTMVICDKHNSVLLDTLRKTKKYLKMKYHPGTPVIQEGLLINWVSCYVSFWETLK